VNRLTQSSLTTQTDADNRILSSRLECQAKLDIVCQTRVYWRFLFMLYVHKALACIMLVQVLYVTVRVRLQMSETLTCDGHFERHLATSANLYACLHGGIRSNLAVSPYSSFCSWKSNFVLAVWGTESDLLARWHFT